MVIDWYQAHVYTRSFGILYVIITEDSDKTVCYKLRQSFLFKKLKNALIY